MKKLIQFCFLSCYKSTKLIEKKHLFGISLIERIQLKLHTKVCKTCAAYEYKSNIIEKGLSDLLTKPNDNPDSSKLMHKILENIEDQEQES